MNDVSDKVSKRTLKGCKVIKVEIDLYFHYRLRNCYIFAADVM